MRPENKKFLTCVTLVIAFLLLVLALPVAAETNPTTVSLLDQFIIVVMRVLFIIGLIASIIVFSIIALISLLPWWVLILTAPIFLVFFYFISKHSLNALRKIRIPSKIGGGLSQSGIPIKIGYESEFTDRAIFVKKKMPGILSPDFAINWIRGDVENGKISWQLFAMGALITLGTSIGIIILLFGHINI